MGKVDVQALGEVFLEDLLDGLEANSLARKTLQHAEQPASAVHWSFETKVSIPRYFYDHVMELEERPDLMTQLDDMYHDALRGALTSLDFLYLDQVISGSTTRYTEDVAQSLVLEGKRRVGAVLFPFNVWNLLLASKEAEAAWDPVMKEEIAREGVLGKLGNLGLITDGFRYKDMHVLSTDRAIIVPHAEKHGEIGKISGSLEDVRDSEEEAVFTMKVGVDLQVVQDYVEILTF